MQKLVLTIALLLAAFATPASSATKWMASNGTGSTCSRTAPCGAPNFATQNDEMHCVDSFQAENFTAPFAFSIICDRADLTMQFARYLSATNGVVVLDGVNFNCAGFPTSSGIEFSGAGTLIVRNVTIKNCADGISFTPSGPAKLVVSDSVFENNGGSGIRVAPSSGTTNVIISNSTFTNNAANGITVLPGAGSAATIAVENVTASANTAGLDCRKTCKATIRNSSLIRNTYGVISMARVDLTLSSASDNGIGILSSGANASVTLAQSRIFGNNTGLSSAAGGKILSFGNNAVNGNNADGAPTAPALALK